MDLIVRHAAEARLDAQLPRAMAALFERWRAAGMGEQSPSVLVKLLRATG